MLHESELVAFATTRDLKRARAFFEGTLGLRLLSEDEYAAVFDAHGTKLRVTAAPRYVPRPFTILGWVVPDIAATVRALAAKGVAFEHFHGMNQDALGGWGAPGGAKVAWFKDPDGNLLSVTQL